ncbi:ATP-binding protein [Streptomyces sp. NPDC005209]|uniref:ATP-binding protein n=1 Tax=Streptomyces sp. NPDC005209 TaxID=3156715 RepID=UPI0033A13D7F
MRVAGLVQVPVVIPVLDKTLPTVAACLDATFRTLGGVPTYCLTDNEKTVTVEHVARIAVRNPELVPIARYYGTVVRSCMPADPASKGGTEATVRIAKRDLVPTAVNLRPDYGDFAELGRRENLCVVGPSGTGKSHFCEALGQLAVEAGMTVAWFTIEDLAALIRRHRVDDSVSKAITRITRTDLILVNDIGLLPVSPDAAEGFYRLVDAAYERRSLAVSSNLHPSGFDEIMPKTLATATVDRLLHHAHVVVTQGDSHRLAEATTGRGVVPLG